MTVEIKPTFFKAPAEFRRWLRENHQRVDELWVGYYKKDSGKPSITWPESVDQALCFGWIDGLRKSCDEFSYMVRFTPRRAKSIWSKVNIARVAELTKLGLMRPAGLRAFAHRDAKKSGAHSSENKLTFSAEYEREFKANKTAWKFFSTRPPGYRRTVVHWVMSAKKEETQRRRLAVLISDSEQERVIDAMARPGVAKKK